MLVSIDVGIKNMALCVFKDGDKIHKWNVLNVSEGVSKVKATTKTSPAELFVCIARKIQSEFDDFFGEDIKHIKEVIRENQISPIANKMKTIQGMLVQYFVMNGIQKIEYISATNKLKDFQTAINGTSGASGASGTTTKKKTTYAERKKMGIEITKSLIESIDDYMMWIPMFDASKKKDDLADCFLQGLWYIRHKRIV